MSLSRKISLTGYLEVLVISVIMLSGDFVPSGLASLFSFAFLLALLVKKRNIHSDELLLLFPLILILLTGIISSFFHEALSDRHVMFMFGKDIWYYAKPIIFLLTGLYISKSEMSKERLIRILLYITLIISVHHIIRVIIFVSGADHASLILDRIRFKTGPGNLLESFSLAYCLVLMKKSQFRKRLFFPVWLLILVYSISVVLAFSRTLILALAISVLAMQSFFSFRLRTFTKSVIIVLIVAIAGILTLKYVHKVSDRNGVIFAMTDKFLNSFNEVTYAKKNPTYREINENWRGLETGITREELRKGNLAERVFGFGFGKTVFVDYKGLQGIEDPNIPKFHNGFMEILLKTGYAGLLFYIMFFIIAFRIADKRMPSADSDKLLKSILVSAFICTYIITGLYNKSAFDPSLLIAGYLIGVSLGNFYDGVNKEKEQNS